MKVNVYGRFSKKSNGVLHKGGKIKKNVKHVNPLNHLPFVTLRHIASYVYGYDALSFAEFSSVMLMNNERDFWAKIGDVQDRTEKQPIQQMFVRVGHYLPLSDLLIQFDSGRVYNQFIYNGFLSERLLFVMNTCQSESFQTYVRLHSYSSHECAYNLPLFSFFEYSFMYQSRCINSIETKLFAVCRHGSLEGGNIVVDDMKMFERNLDNRFGFSFIKRMINFSLFVLAGGAVLNSLLANGFDSSAQDLDFFWVGGCWMLFIDAVRGFKRKASFRILEERNSHDKVIQFVVLVNNEMRIRIQFIFARFDANIPFILYTFDMDIVQVAYDGIRIISSIGFFQAISTKSFICYNLTNNINDTPFYLDRCLKYNMRGFTWICPIAYDQSLAQKPLIGIKKVFDYAFDDFYHNVDSFCVQYKFLHLNSF